MIVPIIFCPSWNIESPPYSVALLKAILSRAGHTALCYDLNMEFYNYLKDGVEKESWLGMIKGKCWTQNDFVVNIFNKYADFINPYINEILKLNSKIIGFSVNQRNYIFTLEVIKMIKNADEGKIIILGGPLCFRNDKGIEILNESQADAICIGEGEKSFIHIIEIIEKQGRVEKCPGIVFKNKEGNIVDGGDEPLLDNLDMLPFADFSDFKFSNYKKKMIPTLIGRGCINRCIFCSEWSRFKKYRCRSAKNIFDEIKYQKGRYPFIEDFYFNDSLVNANIKVLDELCTLIIDDGLAIKWGGQAVIREEMSPDFLKKMKKSGCYWLSYGIESGSNDILKLMRKAFTSELANRVIRDTRGAGIDESFNIIVGFPGEDEAKFNETINFVKENLKYVNMVTLSPLYLSQEMSIGRKKWGILLPKDIDSEGWFTEDMRNNNEVRFSRLRVLKEIIDDKLAIDFDIDVEYFLKKGNECFDGKNIQEAMNFYSKAKEINKDKNFSHIIEEKIKSCNNKKIKFSWDIHYRCNFRCPYCWFYKEWAYLDRNSLCLNPEEWMVHWNRIYDAYGEVRIEIIGGEPFIYPHFIELIRKISSLHSIKITTNLSGDIESFAKEIDPRRVDLDLNFHILFIELETVIKKAIILRNAGFKAGVCYLAYPPQMYKIKYLSERFKKEGINFALAVFWGEYDGKKYPAEYTEEEKELMRPFLRKMDRIDYHLDATIPKGKLCNAGHTHANIKADGNITRCRALNDVSIGNITDKEFRLLDKPLSCYLTSCPCNEEENLLERSDSFCYGDALHVNPTIF
jgi:radical SAM superfamily enzyme YgiQ (UPF0313 family)/MoaA/NifB/PqqE/SkfB family radical SAM enzyme